MGEIIGILVYDSFCDSQMLHLAGLHDPAKTYLGIFWHVIMFGLLHCRDARHYVFCDSH